MQLFVYKSNGVARRLVSHIMGQTRDPQCEDNAW